MEKYELGYNKKSFSLYFNNGEMWCEHLDSLYDKRDLLIQKFEEDLLTIKRPSTSTFIAIDLDESDVDEELLYYIISSLENMEKSLTKVVFVGLDRKMKRYVKKNKASFITMCIDDFQKAKEWLL